SVGRIGRGNSHPEGAAAANFTFHGNRAPHQFDVSANYGQTETRMQSGRLPRGVSPEESLEDSLTMFGSNADAGGFDFQVERSVGGFHRHFDGTGGAVVFDGVVHQVGDDLAQLIRIGPQPNGAVAVNVQVQAVGPSERTNQRRTLFGQFRGVDGFHPQPVRPRIDARQAQQPFDQLRHQLGQSPAFRQRFAVLLGRPRLAK